MGMEAEEGDVLRKLGEKSKKCNKNEPDALQELSGCRDAVQKTAEDSVKMNKEDKKKNKKMNYELCGDAANENGIVEVDIYKKMEKDKKKKLEVDKNEKQLEKERKKDGMLVQIKKLQVKKIMWEERRTEACNRMLQMKRFMWKSIVMEKWTRIRRRKRD